MFDKKDFKYIAKRVIIGLTIAFILFNINKCNVYAYVNKGTDFTGFSSGASFNGRLGSSNNNNSVELRSYFSTPVSTSGYDLLGFPFYKLNFTYYSFMSIDNPEASYSTSSENFQCTQGVNGYCTYATILSNKQGLSTQLDGQFQTGTLTISGQAFDSQGHWTQCTYEENPGQLICPVSSLVDVDNIKFILTQDGFDFVDYDITYFLSKNRYNYESTEIINALGGVSTNVNATTSAINDTLNTINDTNMTGSSSSSTNALSSFNSSITTGINDSVGATSLYTLLTNFTNQLSDTTCQPIVIPIPYTNENLTLPCLGTEFANRIPLLWNVYQLIILGAFALAMWQNATEFVFKVIDPYYAGANNLPIGGGK